MISPDAVAGSAVAALIAMALPVVLFLALRRRFELRWRNVLVGVGIFLVFAAVLEGALHSYLLGGNAGLLGGNAAAKVWFDANAVGFAIYAALAAALFEETGRLVAFRFLTREVEGRGTPVAYAIGHAGAESIFIGVNIAIIAFIAFIAYRMMTGAPDLGLGAEVTGKIRQSFEGSNLFLSLVAAAERMIAFVFQLAFSLLVWQAVRARRIFCYFLAVAAHFAVDFPAALMQKKMLPLSILELEAAYAGLAVLVLFAIWLLTRRHPAPAAST